MNYEKIGKFIQIKRKEKNLTQQELANMIGVTDKAVSKWERGMGCPDVSILELLANALDVSILEILKGRIIENEVIKVTEANDYVKDAISQVKVKRKRIINLILTFLIIMIIIILLLLNIVQYIYVNKKYDISFLKDNIEEYQEKITENETKIDLILNNQGIYNDEDYKKIKTSISIFKEQMSSLKEMPIPSKISMNDLYIMDLYSITITDYISICNTLTKYDIDFASYRDLYISDTILKAYLEESIYENPETSYQYRLVSFPNEVYIDSLSLLLDYSFQERIFNYSYRIEAISYLLDNIIEIGEINE